MPLELEQRYENRKSLFYIDSKHETVIYSNALVGSSVISEIKNSLRQPDERGPKERQIVANMPLFTILAISMTEGIIFDAFWIDFFWGG